MTTHREKVLKALSEQFLLIEGVFLGLYGNWVIDISKYFYDTTSVIAYTTSLICLLLFFLFVRSKKGSSSLAVCHIIAIFIAISSSIEHLQMLPFSYFLQGIFLWFLVAFFEKRRVEFTSPAIIL